MRLVQCPSSELRCGRAWVRNGVPSPCTLACLGLWGVLKAIREDGGGLESELPGGTYLYQFPGKLYL